MATTTSTHRKSSSSSSFFRRNAFGPLTPIKDVAFSERPMTSSSSTTRSHRKTASVTHHACTSGHSSGDTDPNNDYEFKAKPQRGSSDRSATTSTSTFSTPNSPGSPSSPGSRPSVKAKGARPTSIFGSFKPFRISEDGGVEEGARRTSDQKIGRTSSFMNREWGREDTIDIGRNRTVLHYGEVQTNSGLFWKKKEYIVLSETHLVRFKSQSRASETFHSIPQSNGKFTRHGSSPSIDSENDIHSFVSDASAERATAITLEDIVAIHQSDEGRLIYNLELSYLDKEAGQGLSITLILNDAESRDLWLLALRQAANKARLLDIDPIPQRLSEYAARVVEREQDYDPTRYRIYKVVKRTSQKTNNASPDDTAKSTPTVCFLVIGIHKVHIIVLPKNQLRYSTPLLLDLSDGGSFGILNLTWISVSTKDDGFTVSFRAPFQKPVSFQLASLAAREIAVRLRHADFTLRPEWTQRPFAFTVPVEVEEQHVPEETLHGQDHNCFDRTLSAFCVAYDVNPSAIRYTIKYDVEDAPRFELLPSTGGLTNYSALELLAVLRGLRYNESFTSLSFAGVVLDVLNELIDPYGLEYLCTTTRHESPTKLTVAKQQACSLLVQEIRALAISNQRLRRLDFSDCISGTSSLGVGTQRDFASCGIIEALFPLCKDQTTNVDWIALNGIELGEKDLDFLVSLAADRGCHFRSIEVSRCGLGNHGTMLLLDAFRAQENTMEALKISHNSLRLVPSVLSGQLDAFTFIRKLDLSKLAVTASSDALLPLGLLKVWRLEELRLAGTALNEETVNALSGYLAHPQSRILFELDLSNCSISGADVANLMQAMTCEPTTARYLHLDASENNLEDHLQNLSSAIALGLAPTHLSLRSIEYESDSSFRDLLLALITNHSIRYLDLSQISLPSQASKETCKVLFRLFAENSTLEDLNISGENSRLEVANLGTNINTALAGLKHNTTLQTLRIQNQNLGLQGAGALADVLKENNTLRHIHCDNNAITLSGFTDLVNVLMTNITLLYLPSLDEGRVAALKQTEEQIRAARNKTETSQISSSNRSTENMNNHRLSGMRRTLTKSFGNASTMVNPSPRIVTQGNTMHTYNKPHSHANISAKIGVVPQWTSADVQTALRLVGEGWDEQVARLHRFLKRNWLLADGMPVGEAELAVGLFGERDRVSNLNELQTTGGVLAERVLSNTTPKAEKSLDFGFGEGLPGLGELGGSGVMTPVLSTMDGSGDLRYVHELIASPSGRSVETGLLPVDIDITPAFEKADFDFGTLGAALNRFSASSGEEAARGVDGGGDRGTDREADVYGEGIMLKLPSRKRGVSGSNVGAQVLV